MIQVVERAIDIIEFVATSPEKPKFLGEIAESVGIKSSTCATIVKTLVSRRFLEQAGPKKGYTIGAGVYALTGTGSYQQHLIEAARDDMQQLTEVLDENVLLAVLNGNQRLVLHRTFSPHELQVRTPDQKDAYNAASGRLLLGFLTDNELERYLSRYGLPTADIWPEAAQTSTFWQTIGQIRQDELARQSTPNGQVFGLATSIRKAGKVVASLSVYMPVYRCTDETRQQAIDLLRQAGRRISERLG